MPSGTSEERRQIPWGDVSYRSILMAGVLGAGGIALDNSATTTALVERLTRIETQLEDHRSDHPNIGLSRRIDREQRRIDQLEERLRELELRSRPIP